MTRAKDGPQRRQRGQIESLPSGALRVKVYAGVDPLSGRRHYLTDTIPAGPKAEKLADEARVTLLNQVQERRNPRTRATVGQLMDRYLELLDAERSTRTRYEIAIRKHIRPLLGKHAIADLTGETLDAFYKTLRRCRVHCDGKKFIEHRTTGEHECDERCAPHKCQPLGAASVRKIHTCLSGAFRTAIRWQWISVNPLDQANIPKAPTPQPKPPTLEQATAIVNEAFKDL